MTEPSHEENRTREELAAHYRAQADYLGTLLGGGTIPALPHGYQLIITHGEDEFLEAIPTGGITSAALDGQVLLDAVRRTVYGHELGRALGEMTDEQFAHVLDINSAAEHAEFTNAQLQHARDVQVAGRAGLVAGGPRLEAEIDQILADLKRGSN